MAVVRILDFDPAGQRVGLHMGYRRLRHDPFQVQLTGETVQFDPSASGVMLREEFEQVRYAEVVKVLAP